MKVKSVEMDRVTVKDHSSIFISSKAKQQNAFNDTLTNKKYSYFTVHNSIEISKLGVNNNI